MFVLGIVLLGGAMAGLGFLLCLWLTFGTSVWWPGEGPRGLGGDRSSVGSGSPPMRGE